VKTARATTPRNVSTRMLSRWIVNMRAPEGSAPGAHYPTNVDGLFRPGARCDHSGRARLPKESTPYPTDEACTRYRYRVNRYRYRVKRSFPARNMNQVA